MLRAWNTVEDIVNDYNWLACHFNNMRERCLIKPDVQIACFGYHPILIFAPYAIGCLTGQIDSGFSPSNCKYMAGCALDRCYVRSSRSLENKSILQSTGPIASQLARASLSSVLFPLRELVINYPH